VPWKVTPIVKTVTIGKEMLQNRFDVHEHIVPGSTRREPGIIAAYVRHLLQYQRRRK